MIKSLLFFIHVPHEIVYMKLGLELTDLGEDIPC
jgi:hypothetical protein